MRPRKNRIDTSAKHDRPGLHTPFAGLNISNLPASETPEAAADPKPQLWKLGRVVLRRETAHRGGRTVIVVHDFASHLPISVIEKIAKQLRAACGCGGTVKDRTIEIQGDQTARVRAVLEAEGFHVAGVR